MEITRAVRESVERIEAVEDGPQRAVVSYQFAVWDLAAPGALKVALAEGDEPAERTIENAVRYAVARWAVEAGGFALQLSDILESGIADIEALITASLVASEPSPGEAVQALLDEVTGIRLLQIPGGTFRMGAPDLSDARPGLNSYPINDSEKISERTGYEVFDDGNAIFEIAHWFPRLAPYTDSDGWQNKQFLGRGEFALEFGDYRVAMTVPEDWVLGATGVFDHLPAVLLHQNVGPVGCEEGSDRFARVFEGGVIPVDHDLGEHRGVVVGVVVVVHVRHHEHVVLQDRALRHVRSHVRRDHERRS